MFAGQIMPRAIARTHDVQASPPRAGRQIIGDAIRVSGPIHVHSLHVSTTIPAMTASTISMYPCTQPAGLGQPGASWSAPRSGAMGIVCASQDPQEHAFDARREAFGERAGIAKIGTTLSAGAAGGGRT
jgi:hypothetical protein